MTPSAPDSRGTEGLWWLALALTLAACALRFLHLEADPHYYGWAGHIQDEGRWVEAARNRALSQPAAGIEWNRFVSIGFEIQASASFWLAGVGRASARFVPALCGSALVVLLFVHLRRHVSATAALAGLALVALHADYVVLSRLALPEAPLMLASLVTFLVLVGGPPTRRRLAAAGALMAFTVGCVKVTSLPLVPVLTLVAAAQRERGASWKQRAEDVLAFWAGGLVPVLVGAALTAPLWLPRVQQLDVLLATVQSLAGVRGAYGLAVLPFADFAAPAVNAGALGLWAALLAGLFAGGARGEPARRLRSAVLWSVGYVVVLGVQSYAPARYWVHVLTPMALATAYAVDRLEQVGLSGMEAAWRASSGGVRLARSAALVAPSALLLAPLVAGVAGLLGFDAERLTLRLACLGLSALALVAATARLPARRDTLVAWLVFPLVATLLWFGLWALRDAGFAFWPTPPWGASLLRWGAVLGVAIAVSAAVCASLAGTRGVGARWPLVAAAVAWSGIWLGHLAPGFLDPRYSVRDTSRQLGELLAGEPEVGQMLAWGLFIDNALAYGIVDDVVFPSELPPLLVIQESLPANRDFLRAHYDVVAAYEIYLPAPYRGARVDPETSACAGSSHRCVVVLRRRGDEGDGA
jgi:hypothetical protein